MSADRLERDIAAHLNRIAGACERIADALEAANKREADLRGLMDEVIGAKAKATQTPIDDTTAQPPEWMLRNG